MNDELPPDLRRALDAWPAPELPPVDVAAILVREAETQAARARFWRRCAGAMAGVAAALLVGIAVFRPSTPSPPTEFDDLRARLAKLEGAPPPDSAKIDAKLAELSDLLLTLATDVNDRDAKQRRSLQSLANQVAELRKLSDSRWTEAKSTTDALYVLHQSNAKETNR